MERETMKAHEWAIVGFSAWVLASPWILGFSAVNLARWSNIISASSIIFLVLWHVVPRDES